MNLKEFPPGGWLFRDTDGWVVDDPHKVKDFAAVAAEILAHRLTVGGGSGGIARARLDLLTATCRRMPPGRCPPEAQWELIVAQDLPAPGGKGCASCGKR